ncbi:hypothetical protein ABZZ79_02495 [Streptomyces sp. NPDC006458]|uniref:hypothetical protein n=1 Tax=Streptomyces sp. NPDC006458 TaxID=3154302 RepID=UPI0033A44B0A
MSHRIVWPALGAAVLLAGGCAGDSGSAEGSGRDGECVKAVDEDTGRTGDTCLPLAPRADRVDLAEPRFTHPTDIDNPLHPTAELDQTVYGGQVDGRPFRSEVTLMPGTKEITFDGRTVHALTSQYVAFSGGRIAEVALDWYAQADDGSVWYLGEDVLNYEDGVVADTEGTWQAGRDGAPAAMIMPADPAKGDVYRPENQPGVVFEEVRVKAVDRTVDGPYGDVTGAITVRELHMDASTEDKVFAPGYGEFSTGTPDELEAVSLAVPADARTGPVPRRLVELDQAVDALYADPGAPTARAARDAWEAYRVSDAVPELLRTQTSRDLDALSASPADRAAALRLAQDVSDLRLPYEGADTVDRARLALWARQLGVDARAGDEGSVAGDVTGLELVWQRLDGDDPAVSAAVEQARDAADRGDTGQAATVADRLLNAL